MVLRMDASLRGFLVIFDLAQIVNLLWISFKTQYVSFDVFFYVYLSSMDTISILGRTPRDHREFTQPPEFQYAIY